TSNKPHYPEYILWILIVLGLCSLIVWKDCRDYLDRHNGSVAALSTVVIAILTAVYVRYSGRQWRAMEGQLAEMKINRRGTVESSERQLRAYVVCEHGTIFNVANPVPVFLGQIFNPPSEAEITNPAFGPGYKIQIKNSGQTPAYEVRHWGNI